MPFQNLFVCPFCRINNSYNIFQTMYRRCFNPNVDEDQDKVHCHLGECPENEKWVCLTNNVETILSTLNYHYSWLQLVKWHFQMLPAVTIGDTLLELATLQWTHPTTGSFPSTLPGIGTTKVVLVLENCWPPNGFMAIQLLTSSHQRQHSTMSITSDASSVRNQLRRYRLPSNY